LPFLPLNPKLMRLQGGDFTIWPALLPEMQNPLARRLDALKRIKVNQAC